MDEMAESALHLVVAGTREGVLMVESEAQELTEEVMLGAVNFGHDQMQTVIDVIIALAERCAKEPRDVPAPAPEVGQGKEKLLAGGIPDKFSEAYTEVDKTARQGTLDAVSGGAVAGLPAERKTQAGRTS